MRNPKMHVAMKTSPRRSHGRCSTAATVRSIYASAILNFGGGSLTENSSAVCVDRYVRRCAGAPSRQAAYERRSGLYAEGGGREERAVGAVRGAVARGTAWRAHRRAATVGVVAEPVEVALHAGGRAQAAERAQLGGRPVRAPPRYRSTSPCFRA